MAANDTNKILKKLAQLEEIEIFRRILFPEWRQSEKAHPGRSFIDLPRELRDMIYRFFLPPKRARTMTPMQPYRLGDREAIERNHHSLVGFSFEVHEETNFSSLMMVSRQVHEEASSVLYQEMTFEPGEYVSCPFDGDRYERLEMSRKLPLLAPYYASLVRRGTFYTPTVDDIAYEPFDLQTAKQWIWASCEEAASRYPNLESLTIRVPMNGWFGGLFQEPIWDQWKALWEADKDNNFERRLKLFDQMLNEFGNEDRLFPCFVKLILCDKDNTFWGKFDTDDGRAFQKDSEGAFARREKEKASKVTKAAGKKKRTQMLTKDKTAT